MSKKGSPEDRQESLDFLKSHGWDEEKANRFLDDKIGIRILRIPGKCLLDVLKEVCQEGIPTGEIQVEFLVPSGNWDAFKQRAEGAIAKHGGFVFTPEEKAAWVGDGPKTIN